MELLNQIDPPRQAYLYFPTEEEQKTKPGKAGRRFIFHGHVNFDEFQDEKINEFAKFFQAKGEKVIERWGRSNVLLFLQGCSYKPQETYQAMVKYEKWRNDCIPIKLTDKTESLLKKGVIYLTGRTHRWQPIYVLNITAELFVAENVEQLKQAVCLFFELLIGKMMLPGQVENWICIANINGLGVTQLPLKVGNEVVSFMQSNYRGRLYKMFIVNTPYAVSLAYSAMKGMLEETTREKIKITSNNKLQGMQKITNMNQIEKKFNGTLPNITQFWPVTLPCTDSGSKATPIISKDEYQQLKAKGLLQKNKVCKELLA